MEYFEQQSPLDKLKELLQNGFISEYEFKKRKEDMGITDDDSATNTAETSNGDLNTNNTNANDHNSYSNESTYYDYNSNNDYNSNSNNDYNSNSNNDYAYDSHSDYNSTLNDDYVDSSFPTPPPPPPIVKDYSTPNYSNTLPTFVDIPPIAVTTYEPPTKTNKSSTGEDKALDVSIQVKDNYKIYGNVTDKVIIYMKSMNGNYQSEPIDMEGKGYYEIESEISKWSGLTEFKIQRIIYQHIEQSSESNLFWYATSPPLTSTLEIMNEKEFKKGGHYLVQPETFHVHRSNWNPSIQGKENYYVKHGYIHSQSFNHVMLSQGIANNYSKDYSLPSSYYNNYSKPVPTPFTQKLSFIQSLRKLQSDNAVDQNSKNYTKDLSISFPRSSIQLQSLILKSIETQKCLVCFNEIPSYLASTNLFLCENHYKSSIIDGYQTIDFSEPEGNILNEDNEPLEEFSDSFQRNPKSVSNSPSEIVYPDSEDSFVDYEKYASTEKFCILNPNEVVFLRSQKSLRTALDEYQQNHMKRNSNSYDDESSGVIINENTISVGEFLMESNK